MLRAATTAGKARCRRAAMCFEECNAVRLDLEGRDGECEAAVAFRAGTWGV
jgi:hypothetical protein